MSAAVAQGLAFGAEVPIVSVSCMAAIAQKANAPKVAVAIDAKRSRIHWACYCQSSQGCLVKLVGDENLSRVDQINLAGDGWIGAGSGWDYYADEMMRLNLGQVDDWVPDQYARAIQIAQLAEDKVSRGEIRTALQAIPIYHSFECHISS